MEEWDGQWDVRGWREYLAAGETEAERIAVRQCTHTGRPLGNEGFVYDPEQAAKRPLTPRKGSRPAILAAEKRQGELLF